MIEKKTVLILGAGASKPYGFPLGFELRDSVIRRNKDWWMYEHLLNTEFSKEQYAEFTADLAHSGFPSVDAFLEENDKWLDVGKAAIALDLLGTEQTSQTRMFPPHQPRDHWYETLWAHLRASSWDLFKRNPLSIITFNYDRSLEHYLVTVLCKAYKIGAATAARGLAKLPLLHVHGGLGHYLANDKQADFGRSVDQTRYKAAKQGIRIVHEDAGSTKEFIAARRHIAQAERILFVGFGYHPSNMTKLGFQDIQQLNGLGPFRAFGTHKGIKAQAWRRVCHRYGFAFSALTQGSGSITDFINEWIQ